MFQSIGTSGLQHTLYYLFQPLGLCLLPWAVAEGGCKPPSPPSCWQLTSACSTAVCGSRGTAEPCGGRGEAASSVGCDISRGCRYSRVSNLSFITSQAWRRLASALAGLSRTPRGISPMLRANRMLWGLWRGILQPLQPNTEPGSSSPPERVLWFSAVL